MIRTRTVLAAVAVLALATACTGEDTVTTAPDKAASQDGTQPSKAAESKPEAQAKPKAAQVGDAITITGMEDGEKLSVKVRKWVDPAQPGDEFSAPETGNRWVAAQFELTNTGTKVYADSPGNGAQVADSEGQRFQSTFADVSAGPSMTSDAQVPAGEKALGYIVFEVPKASKVVSVQFAMNSGFADQTAQWKVS